MNVECKNNTGLYICPEEQTMKFQCENDSKQPLTNDNTVLQIFPQCKTKTRAIISFIETDL